MYFVFVFVSFIIIVVLFILIFRQFTQRRGVEVGSCFETDKLHNNTLLLLLFVLSAWDILVFGRNQIPASTPTSDSIKCSQSKSVDIKCSIKWIEKIKKLKPMEMFSFRVCFQRSPGGIGDPSPFPPPVTLAPFRLSPRNHLIIVALRRTNILLYLPETTI